MAKANLNHFADRDSTYDVIVIGGGVVGLAILRELSLRGYRCICLEKQSDLLAGGSWRLLKLYQNLGSIAVQRE
eukprot:gene27021-33238_t